MPPETNQSLINSIAQQIVKDKRVFEPDVEQDNVIGGGYKVIFKEFQEGGRTVLRVLLPDSDGLLPTNPDCAPRYKNQLNVIE